MDLTPSRTAVIAVHMQHDIISADGAFGGFFAAQAAERDVIGQAGTLLEAARRSGATAVYTRVAWQPGYGDLVANSPLLGIVAQSQCLIEGSAKAEIVPELSPQDSDVIVTHQRVGGFSASQLDVILRSRGVDTVLFAGVATNASVESTARQASDLGYRTIIVADACSAADTAAHDASVASLGLLAEITTTAEAVGALSGAAAVYTRVAWQPGYPDLVANSPLLGMVAQNNCLVEGSAKAEIVPQLSPQDGDVVVTHQRVGGFSASQLDVILRSRGIDTVVFAGVATNASVEGTARQASDLGYRTVIAADACSAADPAAHEASIASLGLLAEISTVAEVSEALSKGAVNA